MSNSVLHLTNIRALWNSVQNCLRRPAERSSAINCKSVNPLYVSAQGIYDFSEDIAERKHIGFCKMGKQVIQLLKTIQSFDVIFSLQQHLQVKQF